MCWKAVQLNNKKRNIFACTYAGELANCLTMVFYRDVSRNSTDNLVDGFF